MATQGKRSIRIQVLEAEDMLKPLYRCDRCGTYVPADRLYHYKPKEPWRASMLICKHCAETAEEWDRCLQQTCLEEFFHGKGKA